MIILKEIKLWLDIPNPFPNLIKNRKFLYISAFIIMILIFAFSLPNPLFDNSYSPVIYDREGRLLGARVAPDGQWRFPKEDSLNDKFVIALIEAEDRRFHQHIGIDPFAIARAIVLNIREGRIVSGASTISMQTIRLSRNRPRTFIEKIIEAFLAIRLELSHSKNEILALYAANAPFGGNVVGLEAAAWRWFGRGSADLSWAEAATLAVLPNNPALIHPGRNREALRSRRDALLLHLHNQNYFDADTLVLSLAENIPDEPLPLPRHAPHLLDHIVLERGMSHSSHITTIDRDIQERVSEILNRASVRFAENHIMNGAAIVLNTRTGEVFAYVGNTETSHAGDVDIIRARRSSGSLLKPFLFAAMLDSGDLLPASLVSDIPTRVGSFAPENITRTYLGVVPANEALIRSLNVPAARALRQYGVDRFAVLLRSLGLTTLFRSGHDYGLPLILGGAEVTLWEISSLYAALGRAAEFNFPELITPNGAVNFPPSVYLQSLYPNVSSIPVSPSSGSSALPISPGAAWLTLNALINTVRPGDEAIWQEFAGARNIAWKTGTSYGFRDAWAIGLTPEWTVGVWIGNASGEGRAELRSAVTSAPVLFEIFSALHVMGTGARQNWFYQPASDLRLIESCSSSGFPASVNCENIFYQYSPIYSPAPPVCPFCQSIVLNESQDRRITLDGTSSSIAIERKWFVLPPAEEWYYRRWNLDYSPLPPRENSLPLSQDGLLALFNPEPNSEVFIPREIDGREGRIVFSAAHRYDNEVIFWHLDDVYLGQTHTFHEMEARPAPGYHTLLLVDSSGNTLSRSFTVLSTAD